MSDPIVEARDLTKRYEANGAPILNGLSIQIAAGEKVVITGPSGAGKSTLLHLLGGLDRPDSGTVRLGGVDLTACDETGLAQVRNRQVGFIFQLYRLIPQLTILENVMIPRLLAGADRKSAAGAAREALDKMGLSALAQRRPGRLSGGEQQRVAIARALVNAAPVLLADEPTGNLDAATGQAIIDRLWALADEEGRAVALVTHEAHIARRADRRLRLDRGILVETPVDKG